MVAEHSYCKLGKSPEFESLLCSSEAAGFTAHSKNTQNKIFWRSCVSRYNLRSQKKDFYRKRRQSSSLLFPHAALPILHQNDQKNGMNSSFFHIILVQFILFFISSQFKTAIARQGIEYILSPKQQGRPSPSLLFKSFFYV